MESLPVCFLLTVRGVLIMLGISSMSLLVDTHQPEAAYSLVDSGGDMTSKVGEPHEFRRLLGSKALN